MISSDGRARRAAVLAGLTLAAALLLAACGGGTNAETPAAQTGSPNPASAAPSDDLQRPSPSGESNDKAASGVEPEADIEAKIPGYGAGAPASSADEEETSTSANEDETAALVIDPADSPPPSHEPPEQPALWAGARLGSLVASEAVLVPEDATARDEFGWSADADGDRVITGAPFHDDQGELSGAAYIFERRGDAWVQAAELLPEDGEAGVWFGRWTAIEGEVAVVGAPLADVVGDDDDAGAAYVFELQDGEWVQRQRLVAVAPLAAQQFGWTVAIDGDVIIVSASNEGDGGGQKVHVFRRRGEWWLPEAELVASDGAADDFFGGDVDVSGDTIVVGAKGSDSFAGANSGAVYVFQRGPDGWVESAKLEPDDAFVSDRFGRSLAIAGDTLVVGAYLEDAGAPDGGSVYVFQRSVDGWRQQAKLTGLGTQEMDWFGYDVATDGDTIVVGVPHGDFLRPKVVDAGSAVIYRRDGDAWRPVAQISPADVETAATGANYGWATAVAGDVIMIGAWLADTEAGPDAGRAYAYRIPPD